MTFGPSGVLLMILFGKRKIAQQHRGVDFRALKYIRVDVNLPSHCVHCQVHPVGIILCRIRSNYLQPSMWHWPRKANRPNEKGNEHKPDRIEAPPVTEAGFKRRNPPATGKIPYSGVVTSTVENVSGSVGRETPERPSRTVPAGIQANNLPSRRAPTLRASLPENWAGSSTTAPVICRVSIPHSREDLNICVEQDRGLNRRPVGGGEQTSRTMVLNLLEWIDEGTKAL